MTARSRSAIEISLRNLLAGLAEAVAAALPERRRDAAVVAGGAKLGAYTHYSREHRRHGEPAPVLIDLVFEPSVSFGVGAGLALQDDGAAVRQDQPRPHQQKSVLSSRR